MVLGNTFHLFIRPGAELIRSLGGLHEFMDWQRPIITDSGGFQVFSMGHGSVADEIKHRRGDRESHVLEIGEDGVRFRSYLDGSERFMGPETSMEVQAALGSDIALAFDECTPFHAERDYTARSTERTHRWLDRCFALARARSTGGPAVLRDRPGRRLRGPAARLRRARRGSRCRRRSRSAARSASRRRRCARSCAGRLAPLPERLPAPPARDRGRRRHPRERRRRHRQLRLRHADAARAPRHRARPGPGAPLASRPAQVRLAGQRRAARRRLPLPRLPAPHARLPALPLARRRADRGAPADASQPDLHAAADGGYSCRDPGRPLRRVYAGGAVGSRPVPSLNPPIPRSSRRRMAVAIRDRRCSADRAWPGPRPQPQAARGLSAGAGGRTGSAAVPDSGRSSR